MRAIQITGTFQKMGGTITDPVAVVKRVHAQLVNQLGTGPKPCLIIELQYSETAKGPAVQVDPTKLPAALAIPEIWKSDDAVKGSTWSEIIYNAAAEFLKQVSASPATVIVLPDNL